MKCTLKCSAGAPWGSLFVNEDKVAEIYSMNEICHWSSDIVYEDGKFEVITCQGEVEQEKLVTITCTDGVPLVIARALAIKIPLVEMLMRREEGVAIPFSTEKVKYAIELAIGDFVTELELPAEVVDYLFPGRESILWIPTSPTSDEVASLCSLETSFKLEVASLGYLSNVLKLAVAWYKRTGEHNHHLYTLKSEAFGLLLLLLTDWKFVELDQLEQITISALDKEECRFLIERHTDLGLKCVPREIVRLLRTVAKEAPGTAKEYLRWAREVWPKRDRLWCNKELTLEGLSQVDRKTLENVVAAIET